MEKSPSIVNLAKALKVFHVHIGKISKDATNPFFNSKYATLSNILEAIKEPLQKAGLSFTQFPTGQNGLTTTLMHCDSGEFMQTEYFMQPLKNDPQAQGSVISYMRRYSLAAVLGLNLDEDDDANRATHGAATPQQAGVKAAPAAEKPWLDKNSKKYDLVVERLKNGSTTLSQVAQFFKLNREVRAELQSIINGSAGSSATPQYNGGISDTAWNKWVNAVNDCKDQAALKNLYAANAAIIDESDRLKKLFHDRQEEIKSKKKQESKAA